VTLGQKLEFFTMNFFLFFLLLDKRLFNSSRKKMTLKDRVLVVQGGYVSQSHGQQLSITKKSNALDKPKPNVLNATARKLEKNHNFESSNGSSTNNNSSKYDDDASENDGRSSIVHAAAPPPAPAVPEVTVMRRLILEFQSI
jgi:hypothetical protein